MSGFIISLLADFGLVNRAPPRHSHLRESEFPREQTTKLTPTTHVDHSTDSDQRRNSLKAEPTSGDVGILPEPPFFAPLIKDMDAHTSNLEASRRMPGTDASTTNELRNANEVNTTSGYHGPQPSTQQYTHFQHVESPAELSNGLVDAGSRPRHETMDDLRNNQIQPDDIDDLGQTSLPADDGMSWLRNKIHTIRELNLSNNEKARMVHELMTEKYNSSRTLPPISPTLSSPAMNPTVSPTATTMNPIDMTLASPTSPALTALEPQYENTFSLTADDLKPTYVPKVESESPVVETGEEEDPDTEELDGTALGCQHYMRNVKLQCFTCKKWYTCRFCHDEVEDHHLIRRETENMLCMICGHPQPADHDCRKCGEQTAQYYCDICKLWDNDSKKSIYHCNDCGICRIGQGLGKDFFHCKTCCVCLPISIEDTHRCIERSTQCDCPICGDYMFTSPEPVVVVRCGHSIHHKCLGEYSKSSFRCPICSKTITNMESTFRNLDRTIESQPMPVEFKDTNGLIYCNDCGAKSVVKYHWLGLKCDLCESYNTAQIRLLQGDVSAVREQEGVSEAPPRPRSSSLNASEEPATSLAALHLNTNQQPESQLSVPVAAGSDQRFVSYNMTRGRAISPVVSNYFGLPPEREAGKPSSLPFFGNASRVDTDTDYGALNFLSKKLRDRYGFLSSDTAVEGVPEAEDEEDDDDTESSDASGSDEKEGENEEEEDEDEYIDIFGHR